MLDAIKEWMRALEESPRFKAPNALHAGEGGLKFLPVIIQEGFDAAGVQTNVLGMTVAQMRCVSMSERLANSSEAMPLQGAIFLRMYQGRRGHRQATNNNTDRHLTT